MPSSRSLNPLQAWRGRYHEFLARRGYTPRSQATYRAALDRFLGYLDEHGITGPGEIDRETVADYQGHLYTHTTDTGRTWSLRTQAFHLLVVKSFLKFLVKHGGILLNPAETVEFPRFGPRNPPRNVPTRKEVEALLAEPGTKSNLDHRDRAILELLYCTGIRVSELVSLKVYDVDLGRGTAQVIAGKGGKDRVVPLGQKAVDAVRIYLERIRPRYRNCGETNILLLSRRGRPMTRCAVALMIRDRCRKSGIKRKITPHSLRHACATHMLQGQASIRHIQQLLGHKQLSTTQLYTHVEIEDLKAVHARTHPREAASKAKEEASETQSPPEPTES